MAEAENELKAAYNDVIGVKAYKMTGLRSSNWEQCVHTNSSYLDCPTKDMEKGHPMAVTVHNPSNVKLSEIELPVAPGTYSVTAYDEDSKKFKKVDSDI